MKLAPLYRLARGHPIVCRKANLLQYRCFQPDFVPRDPNTKPQRYEYPAVYEPYVLRPPSSKKVIWLVERVVSLSPEERKELSLFLQMKVNLPQLVSMARGGANAEEKKAEKTTFDVKLRVICSTCKTKSDKRDPFRTNLGLKEAKELVEKSPVILEQRVTKDEANSIIEKIKVVGGVVVME